MNTNNVETIKHGNIALLTDSNFGYGILKTVQYQVTANNKGCKNNTKKNTFVQRYLTVFISSGIVLLLFQIDFQIRCE